jgi:hypothetical protein
MAVATVTKRSKKIIRLSFLLATLSCNAALSEVAAGAVGGYTDVVSTVRAGSTAVLWIAGYLTVAAWVCGRPLTKELPLLTMQTIWGHVYGLGLLVFVTVYCLLGVSSWCTCTYMAALAGVTVDDIVARHSESYARRGALFACVIFSSAAAAVAAWRSPDFRSIADAADSANWFSVACSTFLPLAAPFLYNIVRGPRASACYTVDTIVEFIYFATPFAAILAAVVLCTLSAVPNAPTLPPIFFDPTVYPINSTASVRHASNISAFEADLVDTILLVTAADVAMPLLPVTMLCSIFMAVQCALHYDTSEFLAPMSVVVGAKTLIHSLRAGTGGEPALACIPLLLALVAISLKVSECVEFPNGEATGDDAKMTLIPPTSADDCVATGVDDDCDVAEV